MYVVEEFAGAIYSPAWGAILSRTPGAVQDGSDEAALGQDQYQGQDQHQNRPESTCHPSRLACNSCDVTRFSLILLPVNLDFTPGLLDFTSGHVSLTSSCFLQPHSRWRFIRLSHCWPVTSSWCYWSPLWRQQHDAMWRHHGNVKLT